MVVVFALGVFLDPVPVSEVSEAYRAADEAVVDHVFSERDHSHFLEHALVEALLEEVDAKLSQSPNRGLVPGYVLLDVE